MTNSIEDTDTNEMKLHEAVYHLYQLRGPWCQLGEWHSLRGGFVLNKNGFCSPRWNHQKRSALRLASVMERWQELFEDDEAVKLGYGLLCLNMNLYDENNMGILLKGGDGRVYQMQGVTNNGNMFPWKNG